MSNLLLGDRIEAAILSVGVTKERYIAFKVAFGGVPECYCDGRKEDLNAADAWLRSVSAELGSAASNAISKFWSPIRLKKPAEPPPTEQFDK